MSIYRTKKLSKSLSISYCIYFLKGLNITLKRCKKNKFFEAIFFTCSRMYYEIFKYTHAIYQMYMSLHLILKKNHMKKAYKISKHRLYAANQKNCIGHERTFL